MERCNTKKGLLFALALVISACSFSPEGHETSNLPTITSTIELTATPEPIDTPIPLPIITPLVDYSDGFTDCMTFELQVDGRLVNGLSDFSTYWFIDSLELNDKEVVLNTIFGYSLTIQQIEVTDEHTIFSINDQIYKLDRGGILMLSFFIDSLERAQLFWAPHLNQFVSTIDEGGLPPPALRLGIDDGCVNDSSPSYFQSPKWCMEEAKSYYETITSGIEYAEMQLATLESAKLNNKDSEGLEFEYTPVVEFLELIRKYINEDANSRNDCYRLIFPDREVYAWGRNESGQVLCPLLQKLN